MRRLLSVLVLSTLSSCTLYFDDDDDCANWDIAVPPAQELRNPFTGQCEPVGGGWGCDTRCGPCPELADPAVVADWGSCFSFCEGLDEGTCAGTSGCRTAYLNDNITDGPPRFFGCWAVAPSGPIAGSCQGLDAQECSRHDNCAALYSAGIEGGQFFTSCLAENTFDACTNVDCGLGSHCEQQCGPDGACQPMCVPDGDLCAATMCPTGYACVEVCDPPPPGCEPGTPGSCHTECQQAATCEASANETECVTKAGCTPVYIGDDCTCTPSGCTCEIQTYDHCETK